MKHSLLTGVCAVALMISASGAWANGDEPEPPVGPEWGGTYGGFHLGGGFVDPNAASPFTLQHNAEGLLAGGHIGHNFLVNENFLVGLEGDFTGMDVDETKRCFNPAARCTTDPAWQSTVRARLGALVGGIHIYGTGGLAIMRYSGSTQGAGPAFTDDKILTGWTAGGGFEVQPFGDGVLFGVEALYSEFERQTLNYDIPYIVKPESIVVRARVSVRLDAIMPGP